MRLVGRLPSLAQREAHELGSPPVTRLLLASASPARRATLLAAGIEPLVAVSGVDEDAVLAAARERFGALDPADAVLLLAQAKVEDVSRNLPPELEDADDLLLLGLRLDARAGRPGLRQAAWTPPTR